MLKNASLLAIVAVDTAENEPSKIASKAATRYQAPGGGKRARGGRHEARVRRRSGKRSRSRGERCRGSRDPRLAALLLLVIFLEV